ncbi:hypothetical protein ACTJK9_10430, partial [Pseudomonas sp. 22082]|uniref:hypothetical protein n=1 Tax=Pseudomonas sp. 22082 TaxID=3453868 RepID=UPI003F862AB7
DGAGTSKAVLELTLIVVSGEEQGRAEGEGDGERREPIGALKPEFDSVSHVGVPLPDNSVGPLSLRERARVRAAS